MRTSQEPTNLRRRKDCEQRPGSQWEDWTLLRKGCRLSARKVNEREKRRGLCAQSPLVGEIQRICGMPGWMWIHSGIADWTGLRADEKKPTLNTPLFLFSFFVSPLSFPPSSQNARISFIILCPVQARLLIWKDARPPASQICKFSPINCDIVCQPWNKESILKQKDAVFFRNFNDLFPGYPYKYALWLDWLGLVQLHAFLAGAALIVTDYCCWFCPCKTRGGNMSGHFSERITAIRDGILVQHFGFHL